MSKLIAIKLNLYWAKKLASLSHRNDTVSEIARLARAWGFEHHDSWHMANWAINLK